MNNYPKEVLQTVWRRLCKPRPGFLDRLLMDPAVTENGSIPYYGKPLERHNPHSAPNITCRSNHKSTAALTEIIRAVDLGYVQLPPSLLNMAREALRR